MAPLNSDVHWATIFKAITAMKCTFNSNVMLMVVIITNKLYDTPTTINGVTQ